MSGKITGDVVSVEGTYLLTFCCKYYYNSRQICEKHTTLCETLSLDPSYTLQQHTTEKNPNTRLWETNWWMNAIEWIWLTSISSFIIIWGFRWTRVRELNGSHVVTWPTEVQLARTILLSLAPWIPTPVWGRINPCHLTSEAVPPIITQLTSTELSYRTAAGEDKATTPFLRSTMIGSHCQPRARSEIYKCNRSYPNKNSSFWNLTPGGMAYRHQRFGDAWYHHQGLPFDFTYDEAGLANSFCCRRSTWSKKLLKTMSFCH